MAAVQYGLQRERDELRAENERLRNSDGLEYSLSLTNAELRVENERLQSDYDAAYKNYIIQRDENERLRTENEGLKAHGGADAKAVTNLIAENVGLRAELDGDHLEYSLSLANADLRAERDRLRAALREALEKATGCAPVDRLQELEPLWAVLDSEPRQVTEE